MKYSTEHHIISIPIPENFRENALEFAREQATQSKAKQIYLNTLAVQVMNIYLQMLDIPTDIESSDSWNPYKQLIDDVADLVLIGVGRLECRPIRTGDRTCYFPSEVSDNRIGYVVVEINKTCKEAKLLGFLPNVTALEIHVDQLQPLSKLIEHWHRYKINNQASDVQLRQWLEGIYTAEWQSIEELSEQRNVKLAFRSRQIRGFKLDSLETVWQVIEQLYPNHSWQKGLPSKLLNKKFNNRLENIETTQNSNTLSALLDILVHLIKTTEDEEIRWTLAEILWTLQPHHPAVSARRILDLGMQIDGNSVALMVAILPKTDKTVAVLLRVYPMNKAYLPPGLQLVGLYENGQPFSQVQARDIKDDYIQLKFCAEFGERFGVRVSLNNAIITENFVV